MNKQEFFFGLLLGAFLPVVGCILFILIQTDYQIFYGVQLLSANGRLGSLLRLGLVLNLVGFMALINLKKDLVARGLVTATLLVLIISLLV